MQVSSTLLNSESRTKVKCENIFLCVMVANHELQWHTLLPRWHTFKKHWKQRGHHNTTGKKFSRKKILYFSQKCDFYSFISISIHYDCLQEIIPYFSHVWKSELRWPYFSHVRKSVSWWQFVQCVIETRALKIIFCSWFHNCDVFSSNMVCQQKENFKTNKFIYNSFT